MYISGINLSSIAFEPKNVQDPNITKEANPNKSIHLMFFLAGFKTFLHIFFYLKNSHTVEQIEKVIFLVPKKTILCAKKFVLMQINQENYVSQIICHSSKIQI